MRPQQVRKFESEWIMDIKQNFQYEVTKRQEGAYLTIPFRMPVDTEVFTLTYAYERHRKSGIEHEYGQFTTRQEVNIIDLGLIAPDGSQVGASGSDKTEICISETQATPGYQPSPLVPGEWHIILGAYKVAPEGVTVHYELTFTPKHQRIFKGDLHLHTTASDGVHTVDELAKKALRHGLDFLAITDHNQMAASGSLPQIPGLSLIPGIEWTHYQGHASFLGVDQPYNGPFLANTLAEVAERFNSARERGATININHPFEESCPFQFDIESLPFDCLEVWNGPMRMSNLQAIGFWNSLLTTGKKVPICGGSDYHRDTPFIFLGGPTTCIYAQSPGSTDLLTALRQGHTYITFAPNGPSLEMHADTDAIMGDSVLFSEVKQLEIKASGLLSGDILQVITPTGGTPILEASTDGDFQGSFRMESAGYIRVEILRSFLPGLPLLPALISNPIYFD